MNYIANRSRYNQQSNAHGNSPDQMFQIEAVGDLSSNTNYRVLHIYDAEKATIEIKVTRGSQTVVQFNGPAYAHEINLQNYANYFQIVFSHRDDEEGPETPTPGWQFTNPTLRLYR